MGSISAGIPKFADTVLKPFRSSLRYCGFPEVADSLELSTRRKAGYSTSGFLGKVQEFFTNLRNSIIEAFGGNKTKKSSTQHGSGSWLLGGTALASTALAVTYSDQIMASVRSQFQKWGWIEADKRMSRQFLSGQATANASKSGGWFKYAALVVLVPAALLAHHANPGWFEKLLKQSKKGLEADRTASTAAVLPESKGAVSKEEEVLVPPPSKPALVSPTFTPPPSKPPRSSSSSSAFTVPLPPPPTPINWTPSMEILEKTPAGTTISTEKLFTAEPHKINILQKHGTNICHTSSVLTSITQHPKALEILKNIRVERIQERGELGCHVHFPGEAHPVFVSDASLQKTQTLLQSDNVGILLLFQARLQHPKLVAQIEREFVQAQAELTRAEQELLQATESHSKAVEAVGTAEDSQIASLTQKAIECQSKKDLAQDAVDHAKGLFENAKQGRDNPASFQMNAEESLEHMFGNAFAIDRKALTMPKENFEPGLPPTSVEWTHQWDDKLVKPPEVESPALVLEEPAQTRAEAPDAWHAYDAQQAQFQQYADQQKEALRVYLKDQANPDSVSLGVLTAIQGGGRHYYSVLTHTLREEASKEVITLHDGFNANNDTRGFFTIPFQDLVDSYHLRGRQFAPRPQ